MRERGSWGGGGGEGKEEEEILQKICSAFGRPSTGARKRATEKAKCIV